VTVGTLLVGLAVATFWPGVFGLVLAALGGAGVVSAQAWAAVRFVAHAHGDSRNSSLSEAS
jgi:hypothetical protein